MLCQVPNPAPSPEPITRGMQPQRQPQTEQSLPNESSSPTESVRQETHNALPAADALSPEAPDSAKESGNKAIQDQVSQLSRTYEENQLPESENVKNLPLSNDTQPSDVVRPSRQSSIQRNHFISNEENNESIGPNKEIQTPTFGDAAPKSVDATPTTEQSSDSYPEIQRWQSNTPTQADFDKVEQSSTTLASPSPGEHTNIPTAPGSKASYQSSFAVDAGFPGTKSTKNKARYSLIPHSRYSSHNLPSIDVTEETPSDKQDSDIRVSQGFTEDYHSTSYTIGSLKEPKNIPNVQARSGPYPQPSIHPAQQAGVPRPPTSQDSPPAPGPLPHATTRTGADKQRASRPFSFMEYSQSQPTQLTQEHLQREPSIESNISLQTPNRQPSPVSPQRSITRDVSDKHEQTVPTHYDANHDFVSPDNQSGLLRRPRSFSRPFQDPNLQEHPAFRQDGHAREGSDRPTEYYTAQMHHLPRQQTTEYQLEGVGPPSVSRVESKSRSRRSSRSSVFFRNLSTSNKVEGPPSSKDYEGQHAESPANVTAASAKKSKRTSLFRTLTGHNGNERDQNRADLDMRGQTPQTEVPRNLISVSQRNFEKDKVSDGTSSRVPNKLQRASTSVAPEKTVGKKKRFSAIGVSLIRVPIGCELKFSRVFSVVRSTTSQVRQSNLHKVDHSLSVRPNQTVINQTSIQRALINLSNNIVSIKTRRSSGQISITTVRLSYANSLRTTIPPSKTTLTHLKVATMLRATHRKLSLTEPFHKLYRHTQNLQNLQPTSRILLFAKIAPADPLLQALPEREVLHQC